jgi:5-methylthioadenosine/S-adenosylhomocysteine deaminase
VLSRALPFALLGAIACAPSSGDDDECGPDEERVGIYCLPKIDAGPRSDGGVDPEDGGVDRPDTGLRPDTGFVLPDGGFPDATITDGSVISPGEAGRILIRGSVLLTMASDPIENGELYVENGRVACTGAAGECTAQAAGASIIDTNGIVLPGLIDPHNHLAYNWLPEWTPGRLFNDHTDWQGDAEYDAYVEPYSANSGDSARFCAMLQWGEIRALVNGVTTAIGAPQARTCIRWLVRNPELSSGYHGFGSDSMRTNTLGIGQVDQTEANALIADMNSGAVNAYVIHLAEGISVRAHDEFDDLVSLGLLRAETKIIHGTALTPTDLEMVAAAGAPIIWSPSSNMVLYGETLDIPAAVAAGVSISLAPDWTLSGADDPLHEARFARLLVQARWPGTFTERQYLEMLTRTAAQHLAIDPHVGTLEVGKLADVLVLTGDASNPYSSVLEARPGNVRLVLLGGVPT